ncbi:MAG: hypothetical protein HY430_01860 [Candidatus Levybacteria bacterium]|nr:hypothetical protein [Candidatus Levybacteria bacterium]
MKRKKVRKLGRSRTKYKSRSLSSYRSFFVIALGVLAVVFIGKVILSSQSNQNTLGSTTYLAKGDDSGSGSSGSSGSGSSGSNSSDDDDNDSSGGSSSGSGNSGSSGSGSSGTGSSGSSGSGSSGSGSNSSVSSSSTVECVGPDGKKFTTTFKLCEDLNKSWGNTTFSFTVKSSGNTTKTETRTRSVQPTIAPEVTDAPELENEDDAGIRTQTEIKQDETRTEIRLSETERIRTRTKDGLTRIDITSGGIKTRLEYRGDRVIIKAEQEDGTEVELEDDTLLKIDERLGASGIKVATAGAEKFVIQRGIAGAITNFPVSIDLATNTLTVNTPAGQRTLTVLPDQAIQNLLAANIVNRIGGQAVIDAARSGELTSVSQLATLGVQNGVPIYEINGISDQKLLGFIPVAIEKTVTVSAQTGEVVSTQESFANSVLDLLAF